MKQPKLRAVDTTFMPQSYMTDTNNVYNSLHSHLLSPGPDLDGSNHYRCYSVHVELVLSLLPRLFLKSGG